MKFLIIFLFIIFSFFADLAPASAQGAKYEFNTIVLDAGHGGKDIGTPHYLLSKDEKDIALDIVLKLGKILKDSMPKLNVIYTRKTDEFIDLKVRHEIANKAKADLFISVHVNATAWHREGRHRVRRTDATGTETMVLGLHRNPQKSKAIEDYGDNFSEQTGLLDPNDPTTKIIVAQYTQAFLSRSIAFASLVEKNFVKRGRSSYGIRQMGLEVLAGSAMPGVLIETGFINNPNDERYLNSSEGQQQTALDIFHAIKSYKAELERKNHVSSTFN